MIWYLTEENIYYHKDKNKARVLLVKDALKVNPKLNEEELLARSQKLIYMPSIDEIRRMVNEKDTDLSSIAIVSPQSTLDYSFIPMGFFTEIELRSDFFPYTSEQIKLGIAKTEVISKRTGLRIEKPSVTLNDMAGASNLVKDVERMLLLEEQGMFTLTGIFLFGVAGGGKSFFGQALAGTTGRRFVALDLAHFMSLPSPTRAIDEVFDFLLDQRDKGERYLLLIDEIEKMMGFGGNDLVATQVFGKLLTRLNDIYAMEDSNITFVATANNISPIMANNPEFLRKGRFNRLYFMNYPSYKSAIEIFELYKKKNAFQIP